MVSTMSSVCAKIFQIIMFFFTKFESGNFLFTLVFATPLFFEIDIEGKFRRKL